MRRVKQTCLLCGAVLLAASVGLYGYRNAESAIPVIDTKNIAETTLTYEQALQTAKNTYTQIQNQLKNLQSLDLAALTKNMRSLDTLLGGISADVSKAEGLLQKGKETETIWSEAFPDPLQGVLRPNVRMAQQENMIDALDKTYRDALRVAQSNRQIDADAENLNAMLDEAKNAEGNLQINQTIAALGGQNVKQTLQQNQLLSSLVAVTAAKANLERTVRDQRLQDNKAMIEKIEENLPTGDPLASRRRLPL